MNTSKRIKTGGRKKGQPNRLTKELRISLKDILFNELSQLSENLNKLDAKDRIDSFIKLAPYVMPKVENVNYQENEPIDWSDL